ncbi:glycosyltransferase [Rhodopseudomonas palustris]
MTHQAVGCLQCGNHFLNGWRSLRLVLYRKRQRNLNHARKVAEIPPQVESFLPSSQAWCACYITPFFRRQVLEDLGGWDAHNVTEDADLGIRLARHGYRTEVIETVTGEEANCRVLPWVRQRSRWIKGYMVTWAVHMRAPRLLWRQIGPRRFFGFQVMFLGSILQSLLAPLLWSFWIMALGLPHPLAAALSPATLGALITLFLLAEAVNISLGIIALRRSGHRLSPLWAFTLQAYFPLAAFAAYKGLWETLRRPFYWDKTHHGLYDSGADPAE